MSIRQFHGRHRAATGTSAARHASGSTRRRGRRAAVVVGAVTLLGGGVALAAWSISGQGSGEAQAITADDLVVQDQAIPTSGLFPGGSASVKLGVKNPLPYPVTLTGVLYGTVATSGSCSDAHITTAPSGSLATTIVLGPEQSDFTEVVLPDAVRMSTSADDACKGATISVDVTFTGVSS